jgi:DNA-binding PadR family transcriptional regulator
MGKKQQGRFEFSPLEYMIALVLLKHEREDEDNPLGSKGMHGYDILLALNRVFEGQWEAKTGTIYPLLNKMASVNHAGGAVLVGEERKSPIGPVKMVYELTEGARGEIRRVLGDTFENDVEFMERYLWLASQVADVAEFRSMLLNYSNKLITELQHRAENREGAEVRFDAIKQLRDHLRNILDNLDFAVSQAEKEAGFGGAAT